MTDWNPLLADLEQRRTAAQAMGGPDPLVRQREGGRLDARARVAALVDPGSFREIGAPVGSVGRGLTPTAPADAFVAGHGTIAGRPVLVGAEDFTVMGGSIGSGTGAKRVRLAELAAREGVPLVMLLEGAGERARNAYEPPPFAPTDLGALARLRGRVPTVTVVMGVSVGRSAITAPLTDFVVMVEGAALMTAAPPLVAAATGEEVSRAELGGPPVHAVESGLVHHIAADDAAALALVRRYLAFFPSRSGEPDGPPIPAGGGPDIRRDDRILEVLPADPRRAYAVTDVIELLADEHDVLELGAGHAPALVTALVRLGGIPCAVVANNPAVSDGLIDRRAADKATRFLDTIAPFGLPVVFLADTPGLAIGTDAERSGILIAASRMYEAQAGLTGPKLHVTLRRAYGLGAALMAHHPFAGQTAVFALPGARLGPIPADSGAAAAVLDVDVHTLMEHAELGGAYAAADQLAYDDVIDPRELRSALIDALRLSAGRRPASR